MVVEPPPADTPRSIEIHMGGLPSHDQREGESFLSRECAADSSKSGRMIFPKSSNPDRPIFVQPGATDMRKQINTSGGDGAE